jgi:hypothetical protein
MRLKAIKPHIFAINAETLMAYPGLAYDRSGWKIKSCVCGFIGCSISIAAN